MARLDWLSAPRKFYSGIDHGVLYLPGLSGIPWNGLVAVGESVKSYESRVVYFEGLAVAVIQSSTDVDIKVAAYTYPKEFESFTGFVDIMDQQPRRTFGLSYRTGDSNSGQIHLVYNAMAKPGDSSWTSLNEEASAQLFAWEISTKPVNMVGVKETAHVVIDVSKTPASTITQLTNALYGSSTTNPTLPTLQQVFRIFEDNAKLQIIDNGDGTFTARSSGDSVRSVTATRATISGPTVTQTSPTRYRLSTEY